MAERLVKLGEMKKYFGHFQEMSDLVDKIKKEVDDINEKNKKSAGDDDIGKQYHDQVDKPTKDLTELMGNVRDKLMTVGIHGQETSDSFDNADDHAKDTAHNW